MTRRRGSFSSSSGSSWRCSSSNRSAFSISSLTPARPTPGTSQEAKERAMAMPNAERVQHLGVTVDGRSEG